MRSALRWLYGAVAFVPALMALSCASGSSDKAGKEFEYSTHLDSVKLRYSPGLPKHLFDSSIIEISLRHDPTPETDSLMLEWLPSRSGWSLPTDSFMVRDSTGWYHASVWVCPTEPGELLLRWQTSPFTGFTYHLAARYDSTGTLVDWDDRPVATAPEPNLVVRDTMEFVFYRYWPHVFYRRIHLIRNPDQANTYWIITQSLYRTAGASARSIWPSANLTFDERFPLRTRLWVQGGWVSDTLLATVRNDTMVATIDWTYQTIGDNWEKNTTLFREWDYRRKPRIFFQLDADGHIKWASLQRPTDRRMAAQLKPVDSAPGYDEIARTFKSTKPSERIPVP